MAKRKEQKDTRNRDTGGLTYTRIKEHVQIAMAANRPVFMWGPPGVGKSALCAEIAAERGWRYVDLRMSLLNPVDLRGVPIADRDSSNTRWLTPSFLPTEPGVLINFDELNIAPPTVQAAAYQLILDRKCGEYSMPETDCVVVACGNRDCDRAVTFEMPAPLRNRMVHLEMRADLSAWKDWAFENGIDSRVIGFLNWKEEALFAFDPTTHTRGFPTPRSWHMVSDMLQVNPNAADIAELIDGAVSPGTGIEFRSFCKVSSKLPNIESIVVDGKKPEPPEDPSALFALSSGMVYTALAKFGEADKKQQVKAALNIMDYCNKKFQKEFNVLTSKDLARTHLWQDNRTEIARSPIGSEWVKKCGRVAL